MSEPKLDFGPDKPKKMLSLAGAFYVLWNWKSYVFKLIWFGSFPVVWYYQGFLAALCFFFALWGVHKLGKFL